MVTGVASSQNALMTVAVAVLLPAASFFRKKGVKLPHVAIFHGSKDNNIPAETNAIPLAEALRRAGGEVELNVFPNVEHNVYAMGKEMEERLRAFFSAL